jgi:hypothetical protein
MENRVWSGLLQICQNRLKRSPISVNIGNYSDTHLRDPQLKADRRMLLA